MVPIRALGIHHRLHVGRAARVVHLAVAGHVLDERLARLPHLGPVHVLGPHDVVVAAEVGAGFFPGRHEEVLVRRAARGLEVILLIGEAQRPGIARMQLEMEIAEPDHIQAERPHRGDPERHFRDEVMHDMRGRSRSRAARNSKAGQCGSPDAPAPTRPRWRWRASSLIMLRMLKDNVPFNPAAKPATA